MRLYPRASLRTIAAVGVLFAQYSCRKERTQIVVAIDTDYAVPSRMGSLRITVVNARDGLNVVQPIVLKGASSEGCADQPNGVRFCMPLSMLLVPADRRPASSPVEVTVSGVVGTDPLTGPVLVSRTARLPFAEGQTLRLPMFLGRECEGVFCPTDFTCGEAARCIPIDTPPGVVQLDPRTGQPVDGAVIDSARSDVASRADAPTMDAAADEGAPDASALDAVDASDSAMDSGGPRPLCLSTPCPATNNIASGDDYSCARYANGRVACWGANEWGQLGRGGVTPRLGDSSGGVDTAAFVTGLVNASMVALGSSHACAAVAGSGVRDVRCWGHNAASSLGVVALGEAITEPSAVSYFNAATPPTALALGLDVTYAAVSMDLLGWGDNADGAIGFTAGAAVRAPQVFNNSARARSLIARGRGVCWLDRPDTMCAGRNDGQRFGAVSAAGAIVSPPRALDTVYRKDVLALGPTFACGIADDAVSCWGENRPSGVLGRVPAMGAPATIVVPQSVSLPSTNIGDLAAGADFVLARSNDGRVFCWGSNSEGACAFGTQAADGTVSPSTTAPRQIMFPARFTAPARAITAGDGHACAQDSVNVIWCWGRNRNGQAGQSFSTNRRTHTVVQPQLEHLARHVAFDELPR